MKKLLAAASAAVLGLALAGCGAGDDAGGGDDATIDIGIVQLPIFAPIYVADAKGYFEDAGLDVNLQNIKSGQDAIPLASSGKLDVVAAGFAAGVFSAIDSDLDVKIVASMGVAGPAEEEPASALIVRKDLFDSGEITSVADLKGHAVGASGGEGATGGYYVASALVEAGLSPKDVEYTNISNPDMPTALSSGGVDAAFVSAPFWSRAVEDGDAVKLWSTPEGVSGTGVLFGGQFAESDQAQKFFDAMARGAQDLQGEARYSEENLEIIGEATGQTPEEVAAVPLYHWNPNLQPLPDQLADMESIWMDLGALDYSEPLDPADYVDSSFADEVEVDEAGTAGKAD